MLMTEESGQQAKRKAAMAVLAHADAPAIAAVPRIIGAGVPVEATTRCTLPGRAIASITERKVDCADNTLSANPAGSSANVVIAQPSPRTIV